MDNFELLVDFSKFPPNMTALFSTCAERMLYATGGGYHKKFDIKKMRNPVGVMYNPVGVAHQPKGLMFIQKNGVDYSKLKITEEGKYRDS